MRYIWDSLQRVFKRCVLVLVCMLMLLMTGIAVGAESGADAYLASNVCTDASALVFIADTEGTGKKLDRDGRATTIYFYEAFIDGVLVESFVSVDDVSSSPGFYGNEYDTENGWYCLTGNKYVDVYEDVKVTGSEEITQIYSNKYISVENGTVDLELTSETKYASAIDEVEVSSLNELKTLLTQRGAVDICTVYDNETGVALYVYVVDTVILDDGMESSLGFAGGAGTEENPYRIATKEQLNAVRYYPSAYFKMIADIEFTDADFAEGGAFYDPIKKVEATGGSLETVQITGWVPIGDARTPFTGSFDGDGHTISGLKQNISAVAGTAYGGLFGCASGATIENLGMVGSNISVVALSANSYAYVGSIAGAAGGIENCYSTGSITVESEGTVIAGGIVGSAGHIGNCYNTGGIAVESTVVVRATVHVGGIAGRAGDSAYNCCNTGEVEVCLSRDRDNAYLQVYVGGVLGRSSCYLINRCSNSGSVTVESEGETNVGGIVGCIQWVSYTTHWAASATVLGP